MDEAQAAARPRIEVRNRRFGFDEVPRHWHAGRRSITSFFDNLSVFFPHGEQFFIDAVKAHRELVLEKGSEELRREVALFCAQEGMHSREHVRYNAMLEAQGYPAHALDAKVKRFLDFVSRIASRRQRLAITSALEHFTALMGHYLLTDPRLLEGAHPVMHSLWHWHATEEAEHRAVAYDVYRLTGAPYIERSIIMLGAAAIFWSLVLQHQAKFMKIDGNPWSLKEWSALVKYLFIEPGGMFGMWRRWLDYFRPDFHPGYDVP
jgi:predicted metal-dependent hydrolase